MLTIDQMTDDQKRAYSLMWDRLGCMEPDEARNEVVQRLASDVQEDPAAIVDSILETVVADSRAFFEEWGLMEDEERQ